MKDFKLYVLMGLPGSGKTTYAKTLEKNYGGAYICNVDKMLKKALAIGEVKKLIDVFDSEKMNFKSIRRNYDAIVLDGPFFNNNDIADFITEFEKVGSECNNTTSFFTSIEVHHWGEDREACLKNDAGRRNESSINTIKNVKYENVDKKKLKALVTVPIKVVEHTVYIKPDWKIYFEDKLSYGLSGDYLCSGSWCTGGTCGSCWGDPTPAYVDSPNEFEIFDELLEKICPTITFLQYKKLRNACVSSDEYYDPDYYGGGTYNAYWKCYLPTLYEKLKELNLIEEA